MASRLKSRGEDIAHGLFRQGGAVDQHGVQAAGFSDQRCAGIKVVGHGGADFKGGGGGAGEANAIDAGIFAEGGTDGCTVTRQQLQRGFGHACAVKQIGGHGGNEGGLFRRFGDDGVACGKGCGDLAREDGEGKIPRADAGEGAMRRIFEGRCAIGVIAQKINGFTQFTDGIGQGFSGFAREAGEDGAGVGFKQVGGFLQDDCAFIRGCAPWFCGIECGFDIGEGGCLNIADGCASGGVVQGGCGVWRGWPGDAWGGGKLGGLVRGAGRVDCCEVSGIGEIIALGILAIPENGGASGNGGVCQRGQARGCIQRAGGDHGGGHIGIDDLVDEAGICAVFQQAAHKIGQKIAVRADRGVDAAAGFMVGQHDVMQAFAHAMQALKLEGGCVGRHVQNGGHGMGVVGRELRINAVSHAQQFAGMGDVADVR